MAQILLSIFIVEPTYIGMSYFLPHLPSGWHVDEAIKSEEDRVVVIRFGHDWDPQCMVMDETLYSVSEKVQNFAVIYLCDITEVPDFNKVLHRTSCHSTHMHIYLIDV